jgi:hypothetical protein
MSLERIESSIPPIAGGEDRHVEHKHWIVYAAAAKYFSPAMRQISPPTVYFLFPVHSFSLSWCQW